MRTCAFFFLVVAGLVALAVSSEARSEVPDIEKTRSVGQKEEAKEMAPIAVNPSVDRKDSSLRSEVKSSERVEISYEGLFAGAGKRGRREVPDVPEKTQMREARRGPGSMKGSSKSRYGSLAADSSPTDISSSVKGKSPAVFSSAGIIRFRRMKSISHRQEDPSRVTGSEEGYSR